MRRAWAVLVASVALLVLCSGPAMAYTPGAGPAFNNPRGTYAARNSILSSIVRAIRNAPSYSTIRIAAYSFDRKDVADALVSATHRNVNVQMVLNDNWTSYQQNRLKRVLGHDPNRRSFLVNCHGSCRGGFGNQHMKFYLFTKTGTASDVTMVGSANPTGYAAVNQWNDMYTVVGNKAMHDLYSMIFEQLARDHRVANPYLDRTIGNIETIIYPHHNTTAANDPVMQRLRQVHCQAGAGTGVNGHTVIRIVMYGWVNSRGLYIADKVANLDREGCDVRVLLSSGGGHVVGHLKKGGVLVKSADMEPLPSPNPDNGETYRLFTHEKWMILNGGFGAGSGHYVWTGSENWSNMSLNNDEVTIRVQRRGAYLKYLANFNHIWQTHSRWL